MGKSYKYHCNLTSKNFPFSCEELSSTVFINQGREQNRQLLQGFDGRDVVDSFGICQTWFMSNVLPITRGFSTVYYKRAIESFPPELVEFWPTQLQPQQAIIAKEGYDQSAIVIPCYGAVYIFDPEVGAWARKNLQAYNEGKVTHTYLKGRTYICFQGVGIFYYDFEQQDLIQCQFTGISDAAMIGVASCLNYLITWDSQYIYWSGTSDPLNFIPSLVSGSASSKLLAQRGVITSILPVAEGFIVYTTMQAIGATYSNNAVDPWIFREIPGSSGVADAEHVAYGSNADSHIAWTSSGFQAVSLREAQQIWPELSDSIARDIVTEFTTQRTYRFGEWPAAHIAPEGAGDNPYFSNVGYVTGYVYPFHYYAAAEAASVLYDHIETHVTVCNQEITQVSVPARVDWKGPLRIKVSSVGNRYVVVSVGISESHDAVHTQQRLTDSGLVEGEGWHDTFVSSGDGPPTPPYLDETPAAYTIKQADTTYKKWYDTAYVYDVSLNRWGRLDCKHADFFEFSSPQLSTKVTYNELMRRAAVPEYPHRYQDFNTSAGKDYMLATLRYDETGYISYATYFDSVAPQFQDVAISYLALGVLQDLQTSKFGENFGVLSPSGGVFQVKLFDGKYFEQVYATPSYDAAADIARSYEADELGIGFEPFLIHGRYKVDRQHGTMLHGVSMTKVAAAGLVSAWAIPHAVDGECLTPIPLSNVQTINQDAQAAIDANTQIPDSAELPQWVTAKFDWGMGDHGKFAGRAAGDSVSVMLAGHFTLSDLVVDIEGYGTKNPPVSNMDPNRNYWRIIRENTLYEVPLV